MIGKITPIESAFCLTDPTDPRYQFVLSLKQRFARFLHDASISLREQGEENTVDAVLMLVSLSPTSDVVSPTVVNRLDRYVHICWIMVTAGIGKNKYITMLEIP